MRIGNLRRPRGQGAPGVDPASADRRRSQPPDFRTGCRLLHRRHSPVCRIGGLRAGSIGCWWSMPTKKPRSLVSWSGTTSIETLAEAILASQAGRQERLALADDVILNEGPLEQLAARVQELHARYLHSRTAAVNSPGKKNEYRAGSGALPNPRTVAQAHPDKPRQTIRVGHCFVSVPATDTGSAARTALQPAS